jgi:hypothetical protein
VASSGAGSIGTLEVKKLMSIGKYPDVSLALARERHAEARKLLATGIDPMAQRKYPGFRLPTLAPDFSWD